MSGSQFESGGGTAYEGGSHLPDAPPSFVVADARSAEMIFFEVGGRHLDKSMHGSIVDDLKIQDCALTAPETALASGLPGSSGKMTNPAAPPPPRCTRPACRKTRFPFISATT